MKALAAVIVGVLLTAAACGWIWMKAHGYTTVTMTRSAVEQP